jgi:hypothetical protein
MEKRRRGLNRDSVRIATTNDRRPEVKILELLHAHAGKSIIVRVYRRGRVQRKGFHMGAYDVPSERTAINRAFKGSNQAGWYLDWLLGLVSDGGEPLLQVGDEIRVFTGALAKPVKRAQRFASGVSHCVFAPMRRWAEEKLQNAVSKQARCNYNKYLKVLDRYMQQYAEGVPQDAFPDVVAALGAAQNTRIIIELPLQGGALVDVRNSENSGKCFRFMNTKLDHVDLNEVTCFSDTTMLGRDALDESIAELDQRGEFYTFQQARDGIVSVQTLQGAYALKSEYVEAVNEFEQEEGLWAMKIDAKLDPELSEFVLRGMHYNVTGLACNGELPKALRDMRDAHLHYAQQQFNAADTLEDAERAMEAAREAAREDYMCIDIAKSYANFHECVAYDDFPSKLTDLRPTTTVQGPGFYLIDNLDWSAAPAKFVEMQKLLGYPYQNLNVYTHVELRYLQGKDVAFDILEGCWADGYKPYLQTWRFPGKPKDEVTGEEATGFYRKDERGVPFYARYVGACNAISHYKTFWMKGDREYFEHMTAHLKDGCRVRYYENGAGQIEFERKSAPHLTQVTAYINAYERINMMEQLSDMALEMVAWIDKDDITCKRHDFAIKSYMREKDVADKKFSCNPVAAYVSNLWQHEIEECPYSRLDTPRAERPGGVVACLGVGGGGKTHVNLVDRGLRGVLFVPPSYDLLEAKKQEYGVHGMVRALVLGEDDEAVRRVQLYYNTLVWDETSEWFMETLILALERFPCHKHILCGDPGYQLPPIRQAGAFAHAFTERALRAQYEHVPIHRFDYSYRIKCERLRVVCNTLRAMIDEECTEKEMHAYVHSVLQERKQVLTFDECVAKFEIHDAILVSRTSAPFDFVNQYTTKLKDRVFPVDGARARRYRVLPKAPLPNGRIVIASEPPFTQCVEQYASTVHAYQGKTSKHTTFIDARKMFELQHWYTALSRAEYLANVFLVEVASPQPSAQYADTRIYRIVSPNTHLVYIGHTTQPIEQRFRGHEREFADASRTKRCSSSEVLKFGQARIELIEAYPCASVDEAKARERFWIERTDGCVNKNLPGRSRAEYDETAPKRQKTSSGKQLLRDEHGRVVR